ncbi:MAG TPA: hypothetical protein VLL08_32490 [Kineosporiaceae bacterium]|nr:hypothetical protein [Kineosporiaceae bacterium]
MTRVYVPTTLVGLARAQKLGTLNDLDDSVNAADPRVPAHAVTGAVREWYVEGNLEELEYSALIDAAESSLRLLALEPLAPRRRVVVAVDVPEALVLPGGQARSSVWIAGSIELSRVVSVHVDEVESETTIVAAVDALAAAADGDDDARFQLDEAEACDLLWYDISEIDDLIG